MEENVFHYLFKSAWQNAPELQVFGKSAHFLPTIHVMDLVAYGYHCEIGFESF
jgi:hypothetical protein